jgi:hypothetical protein
MYRHYIDNPPIHTESQLKNKSKSELIRLCYRQYGIWKDVRISSKSDIINRILKKPIDVSSNIINKFSKYHLILKAKTLGIKIRPGTRQSMIDIINIKFKELEKQQKISQKNNVQKDYNIFCYPEILDTIYSYADFNLKDKERKLIIKKYNKIYQVCISKNLRIPRSNRKFIKNNPYFDYYNHRFISSILSTKLNDVNKLHKYKCIIWLKTLKFDFSYRSNKLVLQNLVKQHLIDLNVE